MKTIPNLAAVLLKAMIASTASLLAFSLFTLEFHEAVMLSMVGFIVVGLHVCVLGPPIIMLLDHLKWARPFQYGAAGFAAGVLSITAWFFALPPPRSQTDSTSVLSDICIWGALGAISALVAWHARNRSPLRSAVNAQCKIPESKREPESKQEPEIKAEPETKQERLVRPRYCQRCGQTFRPKPQPRGREMCVVCTDCEPFEAERCHASQRRELEQESLGVALIFNKLLSQLYGRYYASPDSPQPLSAPELQFFALTCLDNELYSSGYWSNFFYSSGHLYDHAIEALDRMGAIRSRDISIQAKERFFGTSPVPSDNDVRQAIMAPSKRISVKDLDQQYRRDPDNLQKRRLAFAQEHGLYVATAQLP